MVESLAPRRTGLVVVNALLMTLALGLATVCIRAVLDSPFSGMRAASYAIIWALSAVGFNRLLAFSQGLARTSRTRRMLRTAKWVLPWFLPIPVILALEAQVMARQRDRIEFDLAPVIAYADPQPPGGFSAESAPPVAFPVPVQFGETERGYALWLRAASIDIDGYLHTYDSTARRWTQAHSDSVDSTNVPDARCTLERGAWRCAEPESAEEN